MINCPKSSKQPEMLDTCIVREILMGMCKKHDPHTSCELIITLAVNYTYREDCVLAAKKRGWVEIYKV